MDSKVVLRNGITLDLTANPDFSQVESDEPQVTVNRRYETYFPEKRPFFLENAPLFQTPETLFFSRRILDPEFGARLTEADSHLELRARGKKGHGALSQSRIHRLTLHRGVINRGVFPR